MLVALPFMILASVLGFASEMSEIATMILEVIVPAIGGSISVYFIADWLNRKIGLL